MPCRKIFNKLHLLVWFYGLTQVEEILKLNMSYIFIIPSSGRNQKVGIQRSN